MKNWDKILKDFSHKCKGGAPDLKNPTHLQFLRESLIKFGWKENATNEFLGNLREGEKPDPKPKSARSLGDRELPNGAVLWTGPSGGRYFYFPEDEEGGGEPKKESELDIDAEREKLGEPLDENQQSISDDLSDGNLDEATRSQKELEGKRDKGTAGAGGGSASQGESRYVSATNTMPKYDDLYDDKKGKGAVNKKKSEIKNRVTAKTGKPNYPNKEEREVLETFGWDPDDDKALEYFAKRELWAEEELARIKQDPDSVFYTTGRMGFNGDDEAYKAWMRAAFDGAQATRDDIEHNSNIDSSKPHVVMQSDDTEQGQDKAIKNHLLDEYEKAHELLLECHKANPDADWSVVCSKQQGDANHYKRQYELMSKLEFHDTFVLGQDENGRTTIYHISNKKATDISDPHNNTTPAKRIKVIQEAGFGTKIAVRVGQALQSGLEKVSDVKQSTVTSSQKVSVDSEVGKICETPEMKPYMDNLDNHKKFQEWVKANKNKYTTAEEKVKAAQDYIKFLKKNGKKVPYNPFGKLFAKIGETARTKKFQKDNPDIDFTSQGVGECITIKEIEKDAVKQTYKDVINNITEADKEDGFPDKDGNNGPHTQGYLSTVFHAMHVDMYIDNYDGDASIVLGGRSAQPSDIRGCLAEKSGYDKPEPKPKNPKSPTPEEKKAIKEWREGLKDFLKKRCQIDAETGGIIIKGENGDTKLFKDEWRSAGTSTQKVASYYSDDMVDCMKTKIDARKQSQSGIA